jgi:transposase-like protein
MSSQRYSPEFKDKAVRQIVDRGYSVTEVADRLGVSASGTPLIYRRSQARQYYKTELYLLSLHTNASGNRKI